MPSMIIRELGEGDAAAYRRLRLRALREHPTAFVSSYEEQKDWPLEPFARRLRGSFGSADSFNLGCFVEEGLVGTVGFFREEGPKRMHIGRIVGMHVAAEHQGMGYGRALLGDLPWNGRERCPGWLSSTWRQRVRMNRRRGCTRPLVLRLMASKDRPFSWMASILTKS